MKRVVITGMGIVSPVGTGVEYAWKNIVAGKSGVRKIDLFDASDLASQIAGVPVYGSEPGQFNPDTVFDAKEQRKMDKCIIYGMVAADEAIKDAGLDNYTGNKERIVYFDARTKIHLQNYLNSRKDENKALFVSIKSPYNRLTIGAIETMIRNLGKRLDIQKAHPHKFRRTLATKAIDKGMPIEQLQKLLGHQKIDTTLQYAMVKQSNVKIAHKKYIG